MGIHQLGEPRKILSIEITIEDDLIRISQQKYIESLLQRKEWQTPTLLGCH
jgi:hypothetical protein